MRSKVLAISLLVLLSASSRRAAAEVTVSIHVEGGAARAVGASGDMFGWGGVGLVTPELVLHPAIGVELPIGVIGLATSSEASAAYAHTPSGSALLALTGVRVRPLFGRFGGLGDAFWLAGGGGLADTSGVLAPAVDLRLGADLRVGQVALGPFAGFLELINLHGGARPGDGRMLLLGLHGSLGLRARPSRSAPAPGPLAPLAAEPPRSLAAADESVVQAMPEPVSQKVPPPPPPIDPVAEAPSRRELVAPIRFVFHLAEITPEGQRGVVEAAKLLRERPEITLARVVGYADESGDSAYNMGLSELRARAVVAALIREGVDPRRLAVAFFGKSHPRRRGLGESAQRENRRVEIEILNQDPTGDLAPQKGPSR